MPESITERVLKTNPSLRVKNPELVQKYMGGAQGSPNVQNKTIYEQKYSDIPRVFTSSETHDWNKVFQKVINLDYDKPIGDIYSKAGDNQITKAWKTVTKDAYDLADLLKSGIKSKDDEKKAIALRNSFAENFMAAEQSLTEYTDDKGNVKRRPDNAIMYRMDNDFNLIPQSEWEEKSSEIFQTDKYASDIQAKKVGFGTTDALIAGGKTIINAIVPGANLSISDSENLEAVDKKNYAYKSLVGREQEFLPKIGKVANPAVASWFRNGSFKMKATENKGADWAKNRQNVTTFAKRILVQAAKYGTVDSQKGFKDQSMNMLKEIEKLEYSQQIDYVFNNRDKILNIVQDLNSATSLRLFNSGKDVFKDSSYFPGTNSEEQEKNAKYYLNQMDDVVRDFKAVRDANFEVKKQVWREMKPQSDQHFTRKFFHDNMLTESGDIKTFERFIKELPTKGEESAYFNKYYQQKQLESFNQISQQSDRMTGFQPMPGLPESGYDRAEAYGYDPVEENIYNLAYKDGRLNINELRNYEAEYKEYVKQYKERFDKANIKNAYTETLMTAGLGRKGAYGVQHRKINLNNMDADKSNNANTILGMADEIISSESNAIHVSLGDYDHTITASDITPNYSGYKNALDTFFKGKDSTKYNLTYLNKTPLKGKGAYVFEHEDDPSKALTIYIDKNVASQYGELFASHAYDDSDDYVFDLKGRFDMSYLDNKYIRNLRVVNESGRKVVYGEEHYPGEEAKEFEIPIGDTRYFSIDEVEKFLRDRIANYTVD